MRKRRMMTCEYTILSAFDVILTFTAGTVVTSRAAASLSRFVGIDEFAHRVLC